MVIICTSRTVAAYCYYRFHNEKEWHRARNALEFLDLASDYKTFYEFYKKNCHSLDGKCFAKSWITVFSSKHRCPLEDDYRVFFKWSSDATDSIFFHTSIENRNPDWIGRNIFLEYLRKKLGLPHSILDISNVQIDTDDPNQPETSLELGESAVHFFQLATLCGLDKWKKMNISQSRNIFGSNIDLREHIFKIIYPSILRGLYKNREEYPLLTAKLWDIFCDTSRCKKWLFSRIPDKQHLEFLLGVANQTHFNFWGYRNEVYIDISRLSNLISRRSPDSDGGFPTIFGRFMRQGRFELIAVILIYGFTTNLPDNILIHLIARHISLNRPVVITSMELQEIMRKLIVSLPWRSESKRPELLQLHYGRYQADMLRKMEIASNECYSSIRDGDVYELQHMCRMVLRQRLRDNFQLPTGIYVLHLPSALKKYLNLDV